MLTIHTIVQYLHLHNQNEKKKILIFKRCATSPGVSEVGVSSVIDIPKNYHRLRHAICCIEVEYSVFPFEPTFVTMRNFFLIFKKYSKNIVCYLKYISNKKIT